MSVSVRQRDLGAWVLGVGVALIAVVFLLYPLANAMLLAFVKNGEEPGWTSLTLANFARFFTAASYQRALWNSIYSGVAATVLATAVALPMAYAVARVELPLRGLLCAMSVVPLISPPFIGAYAWIILLGKNGTITQFVAQTTGLTLPAIYGPAGVILALALSYFPYVFLIVQGALAAGDPHIEEAARMAGASRSTVIRTITLPLAVPAIAASMLIVFIKAVGDFGVPSILGGEFQVLPTLIYYQIHGFFNLNAAAAIAAVNVILTVLAMLLLAWVNRRRAHATIGGTASAAVRTASRAARVAGTAYCWLLITIAVLPQLAIALASFADKWPGTMLPVSYTLDHYRRVGAQLLSPIVNSLLLAGVATALCVAFGTVTAYASARGRLRARWALDATIMLPFVLPGLVIGVAYLTAFNSGPLVLTGTALILVLAYFTRRVAFVYRSVATAIGQIDPKLEDASTICGAGWTTTMRRVMVPLAAPAVLSGAILVFSTLIGEISATVLLYSARWKTMAIAIYELVLGDLLAEASAIGTITTVMTLVLVLAASRLAGKNMADLFR
ncbi:MAG: iron ABC transporter permease [Burkholderiales bacterium]|nr:iron ABC transporter permease [Burkholderiales bacterium]